MIRIHCWLVAVKPSFSLDEVVQQFALLLLLAPLMKELDLNWSNGTTPGGAVWRCWAEYESLGPLLRGDDRFRDHAPGLYLKISQTSVD